MILPEHKTKIVATVGPGSNSPEMLERLIRGGMNIARLNFLHGNFEQHAAVIERIRNASRAAGRRVAIMGDLPGPKMRLELSSRTPSSSYRVVLLPSQVRRLPAPRDGSP